MSTNFDQYTIMGNTLQIGNKKTQFKFNIKEYLEFEGMVIVLLDVPINTEYNENVFGVSLVDNHCWQIAKMEYPPGNKTCPFVALVIYKGNLRLSLLTGLHQAL